jgi:hypothetical protein
LRAEVKDGNQSRSVIVGVTTLTGGIPLFSFVREFGRAIKPAAGGLLIIPRREYSLGQVGADIVQQNLDAKKLHILTLKTHRPVFEMLECLSGLVNQARSGELSLGTTPITYEKCQELLRTSNVLNDLPLFEYLGGWSKSPRSSPKTTAASRVGA